MLSTKLRGSKVRVLVNDGLEPEVEDIVTLVSLLDKDMLPLSQVTSISISVSVALLMEMVELRVRGSILPANSGPEGTMMATSGVETKQEIDHNYETIKSRI